MIKKGILIILLAALFILLYTTAGFEIPIEEVDPLYSNEHSQFINLPNGTRIHVRDQGNPTGTALVLIHGSNMSLHAWEPWVKELGEHFRLVTLDMPGHGLTGRTPNDDYTHQAMAEAVDETLTALGIDNFTIGGNSMGGHVAWVYALLYPQRVNALVLLNATGYPDPRPPPSSFRIARMPILRDIGRYTVPRFLVEKGLKDAVVDKSIITDDIIDMYWRMLRREGSLEANAIRMPLGHDDPLSKRMSEIGAPTLILWGKEDTFVPVEFAHQFNKDIENSRLIIYENIGHMPMLEIPQRSAKAVEDFLVEISEET